MLNNVNSKINVAENRKNDNLSEVKNRQTQHIEKVVATMEQSWVNEEERKESKMYRNEDKKLNFLQRLEETNQFKEQELKSKFDKVRETNSRVRERQAIDKKRRDRQRFVLEKKSQQQDSQVRLAQDKSMQNLQYQAEKRKMLRELNNETNERIKKLKFDQDAVKLSKHEQKKLDRIEFGERIKEAKNVTNNSALGIYEP